jgi:type IV secretion system protein VirB8
MTNPLKKPPLLDRSAYYAEAQSWSDDVIKRGQWRTKIAYIIGAVGTGVGTIGLLAALRLAQPIAPDIRMVTVDRSTGFVSEARPLLPGTLSQDEAVTMSNLVQYVIARETIDVGSIDSNFKHAKAFSADQADQSYDAMWQRGSPTSIADKYPAGTIIAVTIKNVSFLSPQSAMVRFSTDESPPGSASVTRRDWASVMNFRYVNIGATNEYRFVNPLGMQITSYRRDAESVRQVAVAPGAVK